MPSAVAGWWLHSRPASVCCLQKPTCLPLPFLPESRCPGPTEPQNQPGSTTCGGSWMGVSSKGQGQGRGQPSIPMWACCEQRLEAPASLSLVAGSQPRLRQSTEILASQAELYFRKRFELFCSRSPSPPRADCLATLSDKCSPTHDFLDKFGIINTTPSLSETSPGSGRAKGGVYGLHLAVCTCCFGGGSCYRGGGAPQLSG